jgi:hypothetical protein
MLDQHNLFDTYQKHECQYLWTRTEDHGKRHHDNHISLIRAFIRLVLPHVGSQNVSLN